MITEKSQHQDKKTDDYVGIDWANKAFNPV